MSVIIKYNSLSEQCLPVTVKWPTVMVQSLATFYHFMILWVELFTAMTCFSCGPQSWNFHMFWKLLDLSFAWAWHCANAPQSLFVPSLTTHVISMFPLIHKLKWLKDSDITQMVFHIEQNQVKNWEWWLRRPWQLWSSIFSWIKKKVTFWEKNYIFEVEHLIKAPSPYQLKKEILMDEKVSSESTEWPEELVKLERQ